MAFGSKKTTERLNEALLQSQTSGKEMASLKAEVNELRQLVEALWTVVRDRGELDDGHLRKAVEAVKERALNRTATACPACGRSLQRGRNICIYCGAAVQDVKMLF